MTLSARARHQRMVVAKIKATPEWAERQAADQRWRDSHVVYIVQFGDAGLIKIGYSSDITRRVKQLQWQAATPLHLLGWRLGGHSEEQRIHRQFKSSRQHGEWFEPTPELLAFAADECEHGPHPVTSSAPNNSDEFWRLQAAARRLWEQYGRTPQELPQPGV